MSARRPRVLYVVSEPWYFANHRLDHARGLMADGFDVVVATRDGDRRSEIIDAGCEVVPLDVGRGADGVVGLVRSARRVVKIVRRVRPDVVHAVALKPVVVCLVLAVVRRRPSLVLGVNGLGISSVEPSRRLAVVRRLLQLAARRPRVELLFQTEHDRVAVLGERVTSGVVIPGVGVDLTAFPASPIVRSGATNVVYLGRAVRSKGLTDLAVACRDLRVREAGVVVDAYCALDEDSPGALTVEEMADVDRSPALVRHGPTADAASALAAAHAAILPSRSGEGVSKFVLEALASGRPVLISRQSGSDSVIDDGETGVLFEARDPESIAHALVAVAEMTDCELAELGQRARCAAEADYGLDSIVPRIVELHRSLVER